MQNKMDYYCAWGDMRTVCSSEEEGYENRVLRGTRRRHASGTFGEAPSVPIVLTSDDIDQQFWAEDELSNSESRQRLAPRRKRRHSISYRNRRNRSRSYIHGPHSSNSSSDSTCAKASPQIHRKRRCHYQLEKLLSMNLGEASGTSIEETSCATNKVVIPECQVASTSAQKSANSYPDDHQASLLSKNRERTDSTRRIRKIRLKKVSGSPECKQK